LSRTCCGIVFSPTTGSVRSSRAIAAGDVAERLPRRPRRPDVERQRAGGGILAVRRDEQRRRPALHVPVRRVAHQPHDLDVERLPRRLAVDRHPLADRVSAEPELAGERLVDHRDARRAGAVALGELAPGEQGDAYGAQEPRPEAVDARVRVGVRARARTPRRARCCRC
jgi:hypothetical protein